MSFQNNEQYKENIFDTSYVNDTGPCKQFQADLFPKNIINSKIFNKKTTIFLFYTCFMSGSCHLDRALNGGIGVECQIFVIVIFFNCGRVLQFGAHLRYYYGALT